VTLETLARLEKADQNGPGGALRELHRYGTLKAAARRPSDWIPNGARKKIEWGRRLARGGAVQKRRHTGADKKIV
jgi:hypothetical protein